MIELKESLSALEWRLQDEIYNLKQMIQTLMPQSNYHRRDYYNPHQGYNNRNDYQRNYHHQPPPVYQPNREHNNIQQRFPEPPQTRSLVPARNSTTTAKPMTSTFASFFTTSQPLAKQPEVINVMKNKLKSLESAKPKSTKKPEIVITTSTQEAVTTTTTEVPSASIPLKNEYTYYWKLDNFPKVFNHAKKNEVFSHVFNVKGLFLRIRAVLQHLENDNLILDIEHLANIEKDDKMEIEISDGLVFKEIAEEKLFQYSFAIMDQTKPDHDLISPIYWNTDNDNFLVPNSVLLLANYVKNDSLLIKLIITF